METNTQAGLFILCVAIAAYFLPTIIASNRGHMSTGGIFALNLFFGWTLLGWVLSLCWALNSNTKKNFDRVALRPAEKQDGIGRFVKPKKKSPPKPENAPAQDDEYRQRLLYAGVKSEFLDNATSEQLDNIGKTMRVER